MKRPTPADTLTPPYTCRCSLALSLCSAQDVDLQGRHNLPATQKGPCSSSTKSSLTQRWSFGLHPSPPLHFGKVPFASKNLSGGGEQNSLWAGAVPWQPVAHPSICPPPHCGSPKQPWSPETCSAFSPLWHREQCREGGCDTRGSRN